MPRKGPSTRSNSIACKLAHDKYLFVNGKTVRWLQAVLLYFTLLTHTQPNAFMACASFLAPSVVKALRFSSNVNAQMSVGTEDDCKEYSECIFAITVFCIRPTIKDYKKYTISFTLLKFKSQTFVGVVYAFKLYKTL